MIFGAWENPDQLISRQVGSGSCGQFGYLQGGVHNDCESRFKKMGTGYIWSLKEVNYLSTGYYLGRVQ